MVLPRPNAGARERLGLSLGLGLSLLLALAPAIARAQQSTEAEVKIHDTVVFKVRAIGTLSAAERARIASAALVRVVESREPAELRVDSAPHSRILRAGSERIVELFASDAGDQPLDTYAAAIAARIKQRIAEEHQRSAIAGTVLSLSLVVFFGLVALYVWRKIGEFALRAREWIEANPERIRGLRLQRLEVVGPATVRGAATAALSVGRFVLQLGTAYLWLVFALSLFDATRPYTKRLTGFVLSPLSEMTARLAAALPLLFLTFVLGALVYVSLRFARLFFASVARGEMRPRWVARDLALPTGWLASVGIVLSAVVFVAPTITGDREGAIARVGAVLLLAIGLALTPLLASGVLGVITVFGRRVRVGQRIEIAGQRGRVLELNLLETRLVADDGSELRIPHLLSLVRPLRVVSDASRVSLELLVAADASPAEVQSLLLQTLGELGERASAELIDLDANALRYRVAVSGRSALSPSDLRIALAAALRRRGIALGRAALSPTVGATQ